MRLMDSICVVVAELVHNFRDPVVVFCRERIADETLELECAALALVVDLVAEQFRDGGVHDDKAERRCLHADPACYSISGHGGRAGAIHWPLVAVAKHEPAPAREA
jgi:hypothetical protein